MKHNPTFNPVLLDSTAPDFRTSRADMGTASNLKKGVDIDDIHPAEGYSTSDASYRKVRDEWLAYLRMFGVRQGDHRDYTRARDTWHRLRPDLAETDPWPHPDTVAPDNDDW